MKVNRIEKLRKVVDEILLRQSNEDNLRCGFVHLYGVATICSILAIKRGLNPEIASAAGMLHDIYSYRTGIVTFHAHNSEEDARVILRDLEMFTDEEQKIIRNSIFRHSDKHLVHESYDELLKDADVLQHFLYNTSFNVKVQSIERLTKVLSELDLPYIPDVDYTKNENHLIEVDKKDKRKLLADIAETLANKKIYGILNDEDFRSIIKYFPDGYPALKSGWCAAFVYHCCMKAGFLLPIKFPFPVSCRFAGVVAWIEWAKLSENRFYYSREDKYFEPQRGDIVVFDNIFNNGLYDHVGIVLNNKNGVLETAEGNVNNQSGIFMRERNNTINGFIRIDNDYKYR